MMNSADNPNRNLTRIFCLSLSGLLFAYATIPVYSLFQFETIDATRLAIAALRIALGLAALGVAFSWGRLAGPLERQVELMGAAFETDYANLSPKTKIRLIVLVTMAVKL